ncbi:MAG TPA: aspartate/glutamate racemase family protein [Acidimicrobiia bacterium]|nr:aspartate/glutamate racemase family protein [Acidimicrobiia bacterium]
MTIEERKTERVRIAVLLAQYPQHELDIRTDAVLRAAPLSVDVVIRQISGSVYRKGLTNLHRAMVAPLVARAAADAEREGCKAIVPYGTLDLGVEEARHVVDIPIMGPGRVGSHAAAMVSDRFAIVCYDVPHVVMFRRLTREWGIDGHVTSIREVGVAVTEMAADPGRLRERFLAVAREAVETEGAELILPLGMTMVPVHLDAGDLTAELGIPVLDPLALSLRMAEGLAATRFVNSRVAYPSAELPE